MASELALVVGYFVMTAYFLYLSYWFKSKKVLFYGSLLLATASVTGLGFSMTILSQDNPTIQSILTPFRDFLAALSAWSAFIYLLFIFITVLLIMFNFVKDIAKKVKGE
ncbi:MAG: hypothetical protein DRH24_18055 [Deltaproteobacteria bacterium]|nr:MAG: hypothetical protein DRH24_18055 [Deltaproteobacteria bacterium]